MIEGSQQPKITCKGPVDSVGDRADRVGSSPQQFQSSPAKMVVEFVIVATIPEFCNT